MMVATKVFMLGKAVSLVAAFGLPLAQAAGVTASELAPLVNLGAIGGILAFFLLKLEPRLRRVEESNDRQTRIVALAVIAMESTPRAVKHQAEMVIKELDTAAAEREAQKRK